MHGVVIVLSPEGRGPVGDHEVGAPSADRTTSAGKGTPESFTQRNLLGGFEMVNGVAEGDPCSLGRFHLPQVGNFALPLTPRGAPATDRRVRGMV